MDKFIPLAQGLDAINSYWFMQDGALPHRTNNVFEVLNEHFPSRVLGLGYEQKYGGGMDWPPYSPDLNPCDFFLWGYLKDKVYRHQPTTMDALKIAITHEIRSIDHDILHNVIDGFESRLHAVIDVEGAHIEPCLR